MIFEHAAGLVRAGAGDVRHLHFSRLPVRSEPAIPRALSIGGVNGLVSALTMC